MILHSCLKKTFVSDIFHIGNVLHLECLFLHHEHAGTELHSGFICISSLLEEEFWCYLWPAFSVVGQ